MSDSKVPARATRYDDTDKNRVIAVFKSTGNIMKTARLTGIPERTIHNWMKTDWWPEKIRQLKAEDTAELEEAYTSIAKISTNIVRDRLENGDFVLNKEGDVVRKPVSLRDAAVAGAIATDKRKVLQEEPQRENELGTAERLLKLVEQFARFSNSRTIDAVVKKEQNAIDVQPISDEETPP